MYPFIRFSALVSLCSLFYAALGNAPAAAHSPEAHTDLICHTSHASECYPAIFQPTERFQRVHDDQSIPPGLHVRLNLVTGLKEARLNIPEPDDAPKADLVLIDNSPRPAVDQQAPLLHNGVVHEEAALSDNGPEFATPRPFLPSEDTKTFEHYRDNAVQLFDHTVDSTEEIDVLDSINTLTEYAHSEEWGRAIASDPTLARIFIALVDSSSTAPIDVRSAAAQLLGTAIQNNPEALDALFAQFRRSRQSVSSPAQVVRLALQASMDMDPTLATTRLQKRLLFLLSQLCHDTTETQLQSFISSSGLDTLLAVFNVGHMSRGDGRDLVRANVANFLIDHVLPVLADWNGKLLVKENLPGDDMHMRVRESIWRSALRNMKLWCSLFSTAIDFYSDNDDLESNDFTRAYQGVSEVYEALDKISSAHGCEGGCNCNFEGEFF